MRTSYVFAILMAFFVLTTVGWAGTVTIVDAGFENPSCPVGDCAVTGWTSYNAAQWTPTPGTFTSIPQGTQVVWVNSLGAVSGYVDQLFDGTSGKSLATLAANTTYTLSVDVGARTGDPFGGTVELLAGGNILGYATGSTPTATNWTHWTLSFDSVGSAYVGQTLEIKMLSSTIQSDFDNVSLTFNADQGGVPEPAMFALVGAGLLGLVARRRFAK